MYCIKCGVKLADSEAQCPLCKTKVYHPDIIREIREDGEELYPKKKYPAKERNLHWLQAILSVGFVLPAVIVLLCDLRFSGGAVGQGITWSGFVIGALVVGYVLFVLPTWFKRPNPVIFAPCDFAAIGLYLLYINLVTNGDWFLSFAFPVVGGVGLIFTTVVTLLRYVRRGRLYIFGSAGIALGGFMLLMEFLMSVTFQSINFVGWSLYPLVTLVLLGGLLIFLGICRPARETMERKFFI